MNKSVLLCLSQVNVMLVRDGEEENFPDELENICSGNNDGNCPLAHPSISTPHISTCSIYPSEFCMALFSADTVFCHVT